ncbi:DUF2508 family protein [Paenibacillus allorhizosphaerae]|uniref:DUF2508 family protein n=1 Tax=Paenibacillus allorhizosphaerae TaxID=2849866 RepID=A0ABN7TS36_9BACL|nr:DUF2508 family protein [Paenibacillus allorhizosphaerae]CAG7652881.1 hypothetical protein PAECIP111802_05343 [Paenibacillus allorhizosphaerae]
MTSWPKIWRKHKPELKLEPSVQQDRYLLVQEIRKAHLEWEIAQKRFDYVIEKEQIDYSIFALEAAEKRFEMLLKQAKDMKISAGEVAASRTMEGSS